MKTTLIAAALILSASLPVYAEQDMRQYSRKTRTLIKEGKHKEALERCLWFHNHALEHDPNMSGVRLSFALSDWKRLGKAYPPALAAMEKIRDDKENRIAEGKGDPQLLQDVVALNMELGTETRTVDLFRVLEQKHPNKAREAWSTVKQSVFKTKAHDVSKKYVEDPFREWQEVKQAFDTQNAMLGSRKGFKTFNENRFVTETLLLIEMALALDKMQAAREIQAKALEIIDDQRLKEAVPAEQTEGSKDQDATVVEDHLVRFPGPLIHGVRCRSGASPC